VLENDEEEDEDSETEEDDGPAAMPKLIPRIDNSDDDSDDDDDDEPPDNAGVETIRKIGVSENDKEEAEAEMQKKYGTREHSKPLRRRQPRKYAPRFDDFDTTMTQFDQPNSVHDGTNVAQAGTEAFRESRYRQGGWRTKANRNTQSVQTQEGQRPHLPEAETLWQNQSARMRSSRKQRLHKTKQETSSPILWLTTEALFITSTIDAEERRKVVTVDIPGAFMHSDMDELVHVRLTGPMATLLVRVDPEKYRKFVVKDKKGNDTDLRRTD
jgi:hypothetical protein